MKALVLAGGHATRLWPITKDRAKPLLPLAGKPILAHILKELDEAEEVDKIYVATNKKFEDDFKDFLSSRENNNYELIIESQEKEEEKYGAVGGIINVIENKERDDYLVIGGDNYYSFDLKDFINFSIEKDAVTNACYRLDNIEEAKNYGVVDVNKENEIEEFEEKPDEPSSKIASTACYFFPEKHLDLFEEYTSYWEGKIPKDKYLDETGRFIEWLVNRYPSYAYTFKGKWMDVGTREGYLRATRELKNDNSIEGSVKDSDIGDNVTVLEGSVVENTTVENSIIFENCEITDSVIKHSLVGEGTHLESKDLRNGILEDIE